MQVSFLAAFDCWALCYSAVGALEYTSAMAYKRSVAIRVLLRLGKLLPPCIHVRILLKIAIRSKSERTSGGQRRKHHLCQYYDEVRECVHARGFVCLLACCCCWQVVRQEWQIAGSRDDAGFCVNRAACTLSLDCLEQV